MDRKITWDTKELKDQNYNVWDLVYYLKTYGGEVKEVYGGSIIIKPRKSEEYIIKELKRIFETGFEIH